MINIMEKISQLLIELNNFNISCNRVFSILNYPIEKFGTKKLEKINGNISFENITFSYNGTKEVLKNLSFNIKSGESIGIVGKSGEGKTTIYNLLCKLYEPIKGKIYIDDIDINELDEETFRKNITVINQNPYIFNLSIKDNLKLIKKI